MRESEESARLFRKWNVRLDRDAGCIGNHRKVIATRFPSLTARAYSAVAVRVAVVLTSDDQWWLLGEFHMTRFAVQGLALAMAVSVVGAGFVEASAPGSRSGVKKVSTKTVTEAETEASLTGAVGKGHAESKVVTVTDTTTNTSTVKSCLSISVKGLTSLEGQVVTFSLSSATPPSLGTGTVKNGRASLKLSSKTATVPTVNPGDTISVTDVTGATVYLSGAFGALQTETESSGK